ncbi:MAG: hypothetical protein IPL32_20305 [Chloracidobacterium sp.]|nr:hypothetical protein [Chloracidobacterium sp.]MBK8468164.1 hypothetical protein [Chloracidobacterium sp.]
MMAKICDFCRQAKEGIPAASMMAIETTFKGQAVSVAVLLVGNPPVDCCPECFEEIVPQAFQELNNSNNAAA